MPSRCGNGSEYAGGSRLLAVDGLTFEPATSLSYTPNVTRALLACRHTLHSSFASSDNTVLALHKITRLALVKRMSKYKWSKMLIDERPHRRIVISRVANGFVRP